ncbi:MAG: signal peptidase I [Rubrivivax sp.]
MRQWFRANRGFVFFLLAFGFFRTAVADWNPIPSGSMRPTLLEGDVVFVDRLAYDFKLPLTDIVLKPLGEPQRGDIVTFHSPADGSRLIKRLVGLPGDTVAVRRGQLFVNGEAVPMDGWVALQEPVADGLVVEALRGTERLEGRPHAVQRLPRFAGRDFGPAQVPPGQYFMLGDNRDNSADSRYIGFVPRELLIGRAHHVLVSADITGHWLPRLARTWSRLE